MFTQSLAACRKVFGRFLVQKVAHLCLVKVSRSNQNGLFAMARTYLLRVSRFHDARTHQDKAHRLRDQPVRRQNFYGVHQLSRAWWWLGIKAYSRLVSLILVDHRASAFTGHSARRVSQDVGKACMFVSYYSFWDFIDTQATCHAGH